eukprot:COSAG04_NODE_7396_length_1135_cov_1.457529_1_plen_255_part_01
MDAERLPQGLVRHEAAELPPTVAQMLYERDQLLWLRLPEPERESCAGFDVAKLRVLFAARPGFFRSHWSVENAVAHDRDALTADGVLGENLPAAAWYVSTILQGDGESLAEFMATCAPFAAPPMLDDAEHEDGAWLFIGSNPPAAPAREGRKKRKLGDAAAAIEGRPEHTDDIGEPPASGTWHVQLQGSKTWLVRPLLEAEDWDGAPPSLGGKPGAVKGAHGIERLRIEVGAGELLIINTMMWWHRTERTGRRES